MTPSPCASRPRRGGTARRVALGVSSLLLCLTAAVHAGGPGDPVVGPPVRLSRDLALAPPASPGLLLRGPGTSSSRGPELALSGALGVGGSPVVNVVWEEHLAGAWAVLHLAGDSGPDALAPSWEATTRRLDAPSEGGDTGHNALSPVIAGFADGQPLVHVVWRQVGAAGQTIQHAYSVNGGLGGWSAPRALCDPQPYVGEPSLVTQDVAGTRHVFVAWAQNDQHPLWRGNEDIQLCVSSDGGLTFGAPFNASQSAERSMLPTLAPGADAGEVYLAWVEYQDDLPGNGYRPAFQRFDQNGPTGTLNTYGLPPYPQLITEMHLESVPGQRGALVAWTEDFVLLKSCWYWNDSDSTDCLEDMVVSGPAPLQGDLDLAADEASELIYCVLSRTADMVNMPVLAWCRVLDLGPLPGQRPRWVDGGMEAAMSQVSFANATSSLSRVRPKVAVGDGAAVVAWMQADDAFEAAYDVLVSVSPLLDVPSWSTPVSVTGKPLPESGQAQARSANPAVLTAGGRTLVAWDDRRSWSPPDATTQQPTGTARGAPDVYSSLLEH